MPLLNDQLFFTMARQCASILRVIVTHSGKKNGNCSKPKRGPMGQHSLCPMFTLNLLFISIGRAADRTVNVITFIPLTCCESCVGNNCCIKHVEFFSFLSVKCSFPNLRRFN